MCGGGGCTNVHAPCLGASLALQHPRLLPQAIPLGQLNQGQHTMGAAGQHGNRVQRRGEGGVEERRRHAHATHALGSPARQRHKAIKAPLECRLLHNFKQLEPPP